MLLDFGRTVAQIVILILVLVQQGSALSLLAPEEMAVRDTTASVATKTLKVLILRHGQSDANAANVIQGSGYVSRLTKLGQEQAKEVAMGAFHALPAVDAVYCSPLGRAQKTWQIVKETHGPFENMEATTLKDLREIDMYDWEGIDKTNLAQLFPAEFRAWKESLPNELVVYETAVPHATKPIQHYPLLELWERADRVWTEIFEREGILQTPSPSDTASNKLKCILIVAHGTLGQALLGTALGWDATYFRQYTFPNCGIAEIKWNLYEKQQDGGEKEPGSKEGQRPRPLASRWRWRWPKTRHSGWRTLELAESQKARGVHEGDTRSG